MDTLKINIHHLDHPCSIKDFLKLNHIGRGKIESIRVNKESYVNGVYRPLETIINNGDELSFIIDEKIDFIPDNNVADILYEDDYVAVVNKPSGIIIHPDDKSKGNTLVNLIASYYQSKNINRNIRFLHRIDKETTGIVLFAKDFLSEGILLKDIETHEVKRTYLALCEGIFKDKKGVINAPVAPDRYINNKMIVSPSGKEAITTYEVIQEFKTYSLVRFNLKTGRTHQIRVHSSYLGHPLLGDSLYGGNNQLINRVALHSSSIEFIHPISKKKITVECDLPEDMKKLI